MDSSVDSPGQSKENIFFSNFYTKDLKQLFLFQPVDRFFLPVSDVN